MCMHAKPALGALTPLDHGARYAAKRRGLGYVTYLVVALACLLGLLTHPLQAAPGSSAPPTQAPSRGALPHKPSTLGEFVRVSHDGHHQAQALETSVTYYRLPGGERVALVAAVHLGERSYYKRLNELFAKQDAVLYELIVDAAASKPGRPRGSVVIDPSDGDQASVLSRAQLRLCSLLGLEFQLYAIHYAQPNFVHADLTLSELHTLMRRHNETPTSLVLRLFEVALAHSDELDDSDLDMTTVLSLLSGQPSLTEQRRLRRSLAHSFTQMEMLLTELEGSALVAGRNQQAIKVLRRELRAGRKHLAIFYGAAHLPHMQRQLISLGARRVSQDWLEAWNLRIPPPAHPPSSAP
jgi:hypothetical protein